MSSALFSPIKLADLELANRVVVSPMCQYSANDGVASDWHITHLGMLANSGAGLLIAEMTDVERRGRISHGCLGLYSDACEAALTRVVDHCHRIGTAKIGVQLAHAGRKGSARMPWEARGQNRNAPDDPWETIAPSAIAFGADWPAPRAMTDEDIERVRAAFALAARRAVRCGFDAIELHMAHGYLLHSFVSPVSNRRNDQYGGALEGRMRFPLEVARVVRAEVPKGTPLGARITGTDWIDGGLTADDAVVFARELTVGLISTPKQAEAVIADGKADMVAIGRAFLDDPHWAWHAAAALGATVARPKQYQRADPKMWPGISAAYPD
jgi:2,4-dienoyl-CoA reductase-like NADH-dependent reductase (Old Yellow Enzyme family)